jgi:hypothetical protein
VGFVELFAQIFAFGIFRGSIFLQDIEVRILFEAVEGWWSAEGAFRSLVSMPLC